MIVLCSKYFVQDCRFITTLSTRAFYLNFEALVPRVVYNQLHDKRSNIDCNIKVLDPTFLIHLSD